MEDLQVQPEEPGPLFSDETMYAEESSSFGGDDMLPTETEQIPASPMEIIEKAEDLASTDRSEQLVQLSKIFLV
jgi:hypothetical protein